MSEKKTFTNKQITYHIIDNKKTMIIQIERDGEVYAEKEFNIDQIKLTSGYFAKFSSLKLILQNLLTLAKDDKVTCEPTNDDGYDFNLNINSKFTKMVSITIPKKSTETTEEIIAKRIGKVIANPKGSEGKSNSIKDFKSGDHIPGAMKRHSIGLDPNKSSGKNSSNLLTNNPINPSKEQNLLESMSTNDQSLLSNAIQSTTISEGNENHGKIIEEQAMQIKLLKSMIKILKEKFSSGFKSAEELMKEQMKLIETTSQRLDELENQSDNEHQKITSQMNVQFYELEAKSQIQIEELLEKTDAIKVEAKMNSMFRKSNKFANLTTDAGELFSFIHEKSKEELVTKAADTKAPVTVNPVIIAPVITAPIIPDQKPKSVILSTSLVESLSIIQHGYNLIDTIGSLNISQTELISNWLYKGQPMKYELLYTATKGTDIEAECIKAFYTKSPLLILIKEKNGSKFGGYTSVGWNIPNNKFYSKADPEAFLFSIDRRKQYHVRKEHIDNAIYCGKGDIAAFNGGLCLYDNFMSSEANWSNLSYYQCDNPDETDLTHEAEPFIVEELYVYQVI